MRGLRRVGDGLDGDVYRCPLGLLVGVLFVAGIDANRMLPDMRVHVCIRILNGGCASMNIREMRIC